MSGDWKPGTVAKATVRGVPDVTVMAGYGTAEPRLRWMTTDARLVDARNDGWYMAYDVTDVRPLVVLDPDDTAAMDKVAENFFHEWGGCQGSLGIALAETLRKEVKPPRIPEPDVWGVVAASFSEDRLLVRKWVRYGTGWRDAFGKHAAWGDLIDPVLVREGVTE